MVSSHKESAASGEYPGETETRARSLTRAIAAAEQWISSHTAVCAFVCAVLYLAGSVFWDMRRPLWNDEIFTRYVAHIKNPAGVFQALAGGADNQPLPYNLANHYLQQVLGDNSLAIRALSTAGFGVFCFCIYLFVRRRAGVVCAFGAALLPLASRTVYYATEGRPYGVELGFCGLILVCWQAAAEFRHRTFAITGLALAVAGAVSCHYMAVLFLVPIGLGELVRTGARRRIDAPVWIALFAGAASILVSLAPIRAALLYAGGFWSPANLRNFLDSYGALIGPRVAPFAVVGLAGLVIGFRRADNTVSGVPLYERCMLIAVALLPCLQAAIGPFTHTIVPRYTIGMIAGLAVLTSLGFSWIRKWAPWAPAILAIGMFGLFAIHEFSYVALMPVPSPVLKPVVLATASTGLPVVAGDPHLYLEEQVRLDKGLNDRLWFIADPDEMLRVSGSNTAELGLVKLQPWAPINIARPEQFVARHPSFFLVMHDFYGQPWLIPWLLNRGASVRAAALSGPLFVFRVDTDTRQEP